MLISYFQESGSDRLFLLWSGYYNIQDRLKKIFQAHIFKTIHIFVVFPIITQSPILTEGNCAILPFAAHVVGNERTRSNHHFFFSNEYDARITN